MNSWKKSHSKIISQRSEELPPSWCPRAVVECSCPISSAGVFRTEQARVLANTIIAAIDDAVAMVVVSSFLLADAEVEGALKRVALRGVRVYVLLATEARLDREAREDCEFDQRALKEHKEMLQKLAGWALIRSGSDFHAKAVLVDPKQKGPGFLLTANLTKEALSRNEEIGIRLTSQEVQDVFLLLGWAMWNAAEHELVEPERVSSVRKIEKVEPKPSPIGSVVATLVERGTLFDAAISLVRSAQQTLVVACFGWDEDHPVVREICARANAGVKVTVLSRVRPNAMPALLALANAGAKVLGFPFLHAKAILADNSSGLVMSANLQKHGLDSGIELGIRVTGPRAQSLGSLLQGWTDVAPLELLAAPRLSDMLGSVMVWRKGSFLEYQVSPRMTSSLGQIVAQSADLLEAEVSVPKNPDGLPLPAHEVELQYDVVAPRLWHKAKKRDSALGSNGRPNDPAIFVESGGRTVVAVRNVDEIARAKEIAKQVGATAIVYREDHR